jgi:hypothetical protein
MIFTMWFGLKNNVLIESGILSLIPIPIALAIHELFSKDYIGT